MFDSRMTATMSEKAKASLLSVMEFPRKYFSSYLLLVED